MPAHPEIVEQLRRRLLGRTSLTGLALLSLCGGLPAALQEDPEAPQAVSSPAASPAASPVMDTPLPRLPSVTTSVKFPDTCPILHDSMVVPSVPVSTIRIPSPWFARMETLRMWVCCAPPLTRIPCPPFPRAPLPPIPRPIELPWITLALALALR